jgi:hypothetical protein
MMRPPFVEPVPDSLDENVDWMTYPHRELYRMVHEGLDLAGATTVSANWARLGEGLGEIGDALARIGQAFADAWQGDAADQARHAVSSLSEWAQRAGAGAVEVSGCITVEVDNAMHARNAMPPPPPTTPAPAPPGHVVPADSVAPNAFTSPGFGQAGDLLVDQTALRAARLEAHRQAAETMDRFQAGSLEVYGTVPQFAPPRIGPKPPGLDNPPPARPRPEPPPSPSPQPPPVAIRPVPPAPGESAAPRAGAPPRPVSPAPGQGSGVRAVPPAETPAPGRPAAVAQEPTTGTGRPAPMGGMPMGGAAAGGEDRERKRPAYLKEDRDIFGLEEQVVAPPVIGEERGRA